MFAGMFPFTVLAVSPKTIAADLGSTETTLAWVVTAPIRGAGFLPAFFAGGVMALLALGAAAFMKRDH